MVYQRAGNDVAVAGLAGSWAGMSVLSTAIAVNALLGLAGEVLHDWSFTHKISDVQCPNILVAGEIIALPMPACRQTYFMMKDQHLFLLSQKITIFFSVSFSLDAGKSVYMQQFSYIL